VQTSMLVLVPVGVAAAFILSSAAPFVKGDIEAVWIESLAGLEAAPAGPVAQPPLDVGPAPASGEPDGL